MAKIITLKSDLLGGTGGEEIYPVSHTKAIFNSEGVSLDAIIEAIYNMKLEYSSLTTGGKVSLKIAGTEITSVDIPIWSNGAPGLYWKVAEYSSNDITFTASKETFEANEDVESTLIGIFNPSVTPKAIAIYKDGALIKEEQDAKSISYKTTEIGNYKCVATVVLPNGKSQVINSKSITIGKKAAEFDVTFTANPTSITSGTDTEITLKVKVKSTFDVKSIEVLRGGVSIGKKEDNSKEQEFKTTTSGAATYTCVVTTVDGKKKTVETTVTATESKNFYVFGSVNEKLDTNFLSGLSASSRNLYKGAGIYEVVINLKEEDYAWIAVPDSISLVPNSLYMSDMPFGYISVGNLNGYNLYRSDDQYSVTNDKIKLQLT